MKTLPCSFFAYPNESRISDTIGYFVEKINDSSLVHLKTWEQMSIGGKLLVAEICKEIERCDLFCADITKLNPNVLFEIGYAIARKKRIWLIRDSSFVADQNDFTRFKILTTLGYCDYKNSDNILDSYYRERPHETLLDTVFDQIIEPSLEFQNTRSLLYLKSYYEDEASVKITQALEAQSSKGNIDMMIDDPCEGSPQPLSWYASNITSSRGVICHLTHYERTDSRIQNAKHSLVAGMAHGFDVPILMLIDSTPIGPSDYRDLLFSYSKAREAVARLDSFLEPMISNSRSGRRLVQSERVINRSIEQLASLRIGEPIAEHEDDAITSDGFIETAAYHAGMEGSQSIFVGRKGVGKTANFKKLAQRFGSDRRNVVCEIKPLSYELESLVEVARRFEQIAKKGYLFEAL